MSKRWRSALHEGAHGIISRVLGLPTPVCNMVAKDGRLGRTTIEEGTNDEKRIVALSGALAEQMLLGDIHSGGAERDLEQISKWTTNQEELPPLIERTRQLLRDNKGAVDAAACELITFDSVSEKELDDMIRQQARFSPRALAKFKEFAEIAGINNKPTVALDQSDPQHAAFMQHNALASQGRNPIAQDPQAVGQEFLGKSRDNLRDRRVDVLNPEGMDQSVDPDTGMLDPNAVSTKGVGKNLSGETRIRSTAADVYKKAMDSFFDTVEAGIPGPCDPLVICSHCADMLTKLFGMDPERANLKAREYWMNRRADYDRGSGAAQDEPPDLAATGARPTPGGELTALKPDRPTVGREQAMDHRGVLAMQDARDSSIALTESRRLRDNVGTVDSYQPRVHTPEAIQKMLVLGLISETDASQLEREGRVINRTLRAYAEADKPKQPIAQDAVTPTPRMLAGIEHTSTEADFLKRHPGAAKIGQASHTESR
jgi:hypothetical protein